MKPKILITKFNYNMPAAEFRNLLYAVAGDFANVPGCEWKICLIDEEKNEGGAVYLFTDADALSTFKESPLVQSVLAHPGLSNFNFRETDIVVEASIVTRAPLSATMVA
ncbi:MAG TPA: YdhR family protein [Flavisolibacter sp.]